MTNKTIPLPGATHGKIEGDFAYFTKRIRVPIAEIIDVRPSRDGEGAILITPRGASHICEDFRELVRHLYGADVPAHGAHFGANIGAEVETARGGVAK